jgi:hypothetical protein
MKKLIGILVAAIVLASVSCVAGHIVVDRPADAGYVRPVAPGPGYIWIDGDWVWDGGKYRWHDGHWAMGRAGRNWHRGFWEPHGSGWRWHRGGWK